MGAVKSKTTVCYEIFRELRRERIGHFDKTVCVLVHPDVATLLLEDGKNTIERLENELNKKILIKVDHNFDQEDYQIAPLQ
jgi:ribonuclease G